MPDLLIRDLSAAEIARIDARARALGLSRAEYVRRRLRADARAGGPVGVADLERFGERYSDLTDPEVMERAWS